MIIDKTHWTINQIGELTLEQLLKLIEVWSGKTKEKNKPTSKEEIRTVLTRLKKIK
jgi:hypothetical protein